MIMSNKLFYFEFIVQVAFLLLVAPYPSSSLNNTGSEVIKSNASNASGSSDENGTLPSATISPSLESSTAGNFSIVTVQPNVPSGGNISTTKCDNGEATSTDDNCPPQVRRQRKKKRQNSGHLNDEVVLGDYVYDDIPEDIAVAAGSNAEESKQSQPSSSTPPSVTAPSPKDNRAPDTAGAGVQLNLRSSDSHSKPKDSNDHHPALSSSEEVPTSLNVLFDFLIPAKGLNTGVTLDTDLI